jgi:2'-5' RNA ligase
VPQPYGGAIDEYRAAIGGRPAETPAHITLVPPTTIESARWDEVVAHVAATAADTAPFEVWLRGTGTFTPVSPVVFIGVVAGISSCERLAARLRSGPLHSVARYPYHPHVTIAHDLPDAELDRAFVEQADFEARFAVTSLTLYVQRPDGWRAVDELTVGR